MGSEISPTTSPAASSKQEDSDPNYTLNYEEPIYAPKRINSRKTVASFAKRKVVRDEVTFVQGLPVTRPERIVFDLVLDDEDLSLVADVLREAAYVNRDFDFKNLANYLRDYYSASQAKEIYEGLLSDAGLPSEKDRL